MLRLTSSIDWILNKNSLTLTEFKTALEKERISTVLQWDKKGVLENICYVDHLTKAVFYTATLGDKYTVARMQQRCIPEKIHTKKWTWKQQHKQQHPHRQELRH
jgi:hypothetical protein